MQFCCIHGNVIHYLSVNIEIVFVLLYHEKKIELQQRVFASRQF